jgi:cytoskeletal protein CcmA (bactofilin family)
MKHTTLFATLGAGFCVLAALSCSGGGGGGTGVPSASTTPVTSSGTITKFGSVYINDRKYEIDDSTSTSVDGSAAVKGDVEAKKILKVGMVVTVSGTASGSSRTASTITHTDTLEGPIQAKDPAKSTLTILGQTVVVDDTTKFDDTVPATTFASLVVGNVVEVSGFVKSDGVIAASFIERKAGAPTNCSQGCEIKGIVKSHIAGATTFQIGDLIVNYAAPAIISDMPTPIVDNWNNLFVEVKGTSLVGTTLTATKVEPEGFQAPEGNEVELEGFVTSVLGVGHFMLGTTEIQAANAVYLGGTKDEVAVGQNLEVEGTISGNVITATKVKFQDSVRLEGIVNSIAGSTMTLVGMPTITITSNSATEVTGNTPVVGDRVKVRGREGATVNSVIATEVDGNGSDSCYTNANINDCDVDLQGAVQAIPAPNQTLTILGVVIDTSGFSDPDFKGTSDQEIGRAAFFNAVNVGTVVQVKGRLTNGVITWREVELEEE